MKTTHVRAQDLPERWLLYDASSEPLGRLASKIAFTLMGKDRPTYTPSEPNGAFVVVINAAQSVFTGNKEANKYYRTFSGYAGGLKHHSVPKMRAEKPEEMVRLAVRRMLPKSNLGRQLLTRLKVYAAAEHPHGAQKPQAVATKA